MKTLVLSAIGFAVKRPVPLINAHFFAVQFSHKNLFGAVAVNLWAVMTVAQGCFLYLQFSNLLNLHFVYLVCGALPYIEHFVHYLTDSVKLR